MKIDINYIARVEGEITKKLEIEEGKLKELRLNIWEPPRFPGFFLWEGNLTRFRTSLQGYAGYVPYPT